MPDPGETVADGTEFIWPVRVYYEDTDAGGVVYYANYLKFMERARTEWLRSLGFEQDTLLQQQRVVFPVQRVDIEYLQPARFNDSLSVHVRMINLGRTSILSGQTIFRDTDRTLLTRGEVRIACVDVDTFRPRAIPEAIQNAMKRFITHAD